MPLTAVNIDKESLAKLDESASFRSSSREETLREAINYLSEYDRDYRESVEAGLKDIAEGRTISNEQMNLEAKTLIQHFRDQRSKR